MRKSLLQLIKKSIIVFFLVLFLNWFIQVTRHLPHQGRGGGKGVRPVHCRLSVRIRHTRSLAIRLTANAHLLFFDEEVHGDKARASWGTSPRST